VGETARLAPAGENEVWVGIERGHPGEGGALLPPVVEIRRSDGEERAPGRMSLPERYEAVGIWVGKRLEEHAVYHAEDGGIGADTERQREVPSANS
jgi:hypothetical protein